ncbi:hypothetical protein WG899_18130 [Paucibacter sp. AS339]|uniref:hypothetical protein n=1 Tax=Paucibacter hankyongi TaxID=3133434 RepID=UPI0030A3F732
MQASAILSSGLGRRRLLGAAAACCAVGPVRAAASVMTVCHDMQPLQGEADSFALSVLTLLLNKTVASHGPYRFEPMEPRDNITQSRTMLELRDAKLDVVASMNSRARDADGIQVRGCMRRGLNGIRLPICLASRQAEFENIKSLEQARQFSIAQVAHWPDAAVLEANAWPAQRIPKLSIFSAMLTRHRFDLFALASDEAYGIVDVIPELVVLKQWAIAYPSTFAFMVSHRRPELAERLRHGWRVVLADGSFEAMHDKAVGWQVRKANLAARRWLVLHNPDQPPDALKQDPRLWSPLVRQRLIEPLLRKV